MVDGAWRETKFDEVLRGDAPAKKIQHETLCSIQFLLRHWDQKYTISDREKVIMKARARY